MKFSVIDIEGTGGNTSRSRIMEIAIYVYDSESGEITDRFSTLVNPGIKPDWYVQKMTGITPKMLRRAPAFHEIAKRVVEMTENTVLTAHNADFDYGILKKEFQRLGYDFQRPVLDTVHLSRKLLSGLKSYGLDQLVKELKIVATDRHRAFGDAQATVEILKILLQKDPSRKTIRNLIDKRQHISEKNQKIKELNLIDRLPHKPGLLKIFDKKNRLIYVDFKADLKFAAEKLITGHLDIQTNIRFAEGEIIYSPVIGKIMTWQIRKKINPPYSPFRKPKEKPPLLPYDKALFFDKGKNEKDSGIILIENGLPRAYGFVSLNWQKENFEDLKKRLSSMEDCIHAQKLVVDYWKKNYFKKIEISDEKTDSH